MSSRISANFFFLAQYVSRVKGFSTATTSHSVSLFFLLLIFSSQLIAAGEQVWWAGPSPTGQRFATKAEAIADFQTFSEEHALMTEEESSYLNEATGNQVFVYKIPDADPIVCW